MTDERMDARLRRAGEAWRAAETTAAVDVTSRVEELAAPPTDRPRRVRRVGLLASAAIVAAALVAGGGFLVANLGSDNGRPTSTEAGPQSLAGTNWALATITDADGHDVPVAGKPVLGIDDSTHVGGTDGCNKFGGDISIDSAVIRFGALELSETACSDDRVTATAEHVDAVLSGDVAWSIDDGMLTLSKAGAGTLAYRSAPSGERSTDPSDLVGVTWTLTTIADASGGTAKTPDRPISIRISAGELDVPCEHAAVQVGNGMLDIGPFHGDNPSALGCTGFAIAGQHVADVLTGHVTWVIDGDRLTITKDGVGALIYKRSGDKTDLAALVGHTWTLTGIEHETAGGGTGGGSSSMSDIAVTFDRGTITIKHRCYTDKGDVRLGDTTLDISHVKLDNAIPCTSPTDPNEDQTNATVDDVLTGSVQWQLSDGQLQITKGSTTLDLTAAGSSQAQQPPLTGTAWKLTDNGSSDTGIRLTIDNDGTYRLQTLCGVQGGSAAITAGAITFSHRHTIEDHSCPAPANDEGARLLEVLDGTAKWSIADGQLTLGSASGKLIFSAS